MEYKKDIQQLFVDFLHNDYTKEDLEQLIAYFGEEHSLEMLREKIEKELAAEMKDDDVRVKRLVRRLDERLLKQLGETPILPLPKRRSHVQWLAWVGTAAAVIAMLVLWLRQPDAARDTPLVAAQKQLPTNDVLPGESQATLILADGKQFNLDGKEKFSQSVNGAQISSNHGELIYEQKSATDEVAHEPLNTLVVPKAGTFQMRLPDGTRVWLNAYSQLRFPKSFSAHERKVWVTGEAYFEVAKDAKRPFSVQVGETLIKALGTAFNVRAYNEGETSATLTDGSIQVTYKDQSVKLIPGQQALLNPSAKLTVRRVDLESATAWKDGYFYFKKEPFEKIIQDVALWYDVTIHDEGPVPNELYSGSVDRQAKLSEVLEMLRAVSETRFELKGRELYIVH
ncbi:DUF4974 domain-containing protein [Olivibacter ginsenosidimutans]|uniref:DUF4974 domain-containing protein n=1 Tax=Olivibacter ginsenosidimutans TaxID=1176537 RepID=A0ABP9AIB4_9SPHI